MELITPKLFRQFTYILNAIYMQIHGIMKIIIVHFPIDYFESCKHRLFNLNCAIPKRLFIPKIHQYNTTSLREP